MLSPATAYVPGFTTDIFVSYAHRDDTAWVTSFQTSLAQAVAKLLGADIAVWQDLEQIRAGQNWQKEFEAAVRGTATVIAVSSPSYANSEWCTKERAIFGEQVDLESDGRFFIALKTPWRKKGHQEFLPKNKSVSFTRDDGAELIPGTEEFSDAINLLASSVALQLQQMRRARSRVFVASPAADCLQVWKQLALELRQRGYDVQPDGLRDSSFTDALLASEMSGAMLFFHLLGATYDAGASRQIRLAVAAGSGQVFCLLEPDHQLHPLQKAVVSRLRAGLLPASKEQRIPGEWVLLDQAPPGQLIDDVLELLKRKKASLEPPSDGRRSVYIVHDLTTPSDAAIARSLQEELSKREAIAFNVLRTDRRGPGWLREQHDALLRSCDGVLLCHDAAPSEWMDLMAPEVLVPERRYEREPLRSRGLLRSRPSLWDDLDVPNLSVIPCRTPLPVGDLERFLAPLRA